MAIYIEIEKTKHDKHIRTAHHIKEKLCELIDSMHEVCEESEDYLDERRGRSGHRRGVRGSGRSGYRHDEREMDDRYDY